MSSLVYLLQQQQHPHAAEKMRENLPALAFSLHTQASKPRWKKHGKREIVLYNYTILLGTLGLSLDLDLQTEASRVSSLDFEL